MSSEKTSYEASDVDESPTKVRPFKLRSLAANFVEEEHASYVRHLENAVTDTKIRNIALTGRYGSGKSSVLDHFEAKHKRRTIRISINTLGPDEGEEDLTNRIQKELVKQIIYRAKPGKLRRSRFARSAPLTRWRALLQAFAFTAVLGALLWLIGLRPGPEWFLGTDDMVLKIALGATFFALVVLILTTVRWIIGDRIVSQVSTAGTTIALGEEPKTYFDGFLDEIVTFFDATKPRFVIFEDLDRFDDPQIFDSLRELNTLINASANWKRRRHPLRFIYAIKDSLFEQLGAEAEPNPDVDGPPKARSNTIEEQSTPTNAAMLKAQQKQQDMAAAAVERANRTKFFELVIPMVPFLSHRNARDHLIDILNELGIPKDFVSRPLMDLVARHATDMRLLINICNEFAVYVERLLWVANPTPRMVADHLFALVAYKNFHLADFEAIPQRASSLDALEESHRDFVRKTIESLQSERRSMLQRTDALEARTQLAETLGGRLLALKDVFVLQGNNFGYPRVGFSIGGEPHDMEQATSVAFWTRVAEHGSISIVNSGYSNLTTSLDRTQLTRLFPQSTDVEFWEDVSLDELTAKITSLDRTISSLRGADFSDLARYESATSVNAPFGEQIKKTLKSELARDLVLRGFITRNYAEYSAKFYGSFIGVDVAFFYNHSVQPNEMYVDYEFTTPNAIENLLEQAPADFTKSVSSLNVQVVSFLLERDDVRAREVVALIVADRSADSRVFLDAFFNTAGAPHEALVQLLAQHPWPELFEYITGDGGIPDDKTRRRLYDTALLNGRPTDSYDLNNETRSYLTENYLHFDAFRLEQSPECARTVYAFADAAGLIVTDLDMVATPLRTWVVNADRYELTANNLQIALGISETPTLDRVRADRSVWRYCRQNIDRYLKELQRSAPDEALVQSESVLTDIIIEGEGTWSLDQLYDVIAASDQASALSDVSLVSEQAWPALASAGRMTPRVANIWAYARAIGVDEELGRLLCPDESVAIALLDVAGVDLEDRKSLAVKILNAPVLSAAQRVRVVTQLDLPQGIDAALLAPLGDDLLAHLLGLGLVPDDVASFTHFARAGWPSVARAFTVSQNVEQIFTPALVSPFVAEMLDSNPTPPSLGEAVIDNLAAYIPSDNANALRAAGEYALRHKLKMPLEQVGRIARVTQDPDLVLPHLVRAKDISVDEIVSVLVVLGEPYDQLLQGPGAEFTLPPGSSNNTLFQRLVDAGRVEIIKKEWGAGKLVRTLA
ncbi:hypothetical protein [Microbacterium maritypicum]|uniref:YobI family P-loop NTPase n=1 Tax=Microbacterium maritypicum TaxID=33918 RepID=UPI003D730731